jgi:peptide/nickel transport system substrate-binding protein
MMSKHHKLNALLGLLIIFSMVLAACGGGGAAPAAPAEPAAAEATKAPEAAAEATKAPEAAAPAEAAPTVELQGAVEYPEPPVLELGGAEVKRLPIDQIVTYKKLDKYQEPAWVTELVKAGKLPPVEERLPEEPQVVLTSGMSSGVGEYGDAWRDFSACPTAGWNNGAGVSSGWFGIESMSYDYNALVKTGPLFRASQDVEPYPNLAMSWEWSEDGKQLTMNLIRGAKWSDGQPFTSEDVMFTWEDLINDPNVNRLGVKSDAWQINGEATTLEAIDEYTVRFTFPVAKPLEKFYIMNEGNFSVSPAHQLKPLHPKYNQDMDYKEFENILPPDKLPQVTMGPWAAVEYKTDELLVMRRNPYFWKVDEEGKQLPYIDEATYRKGPSGTGRTLCTLGGECDHTNVENPSSEYIETLKKAQDPNATFSLYWGPELLTFSLEVNQSADFGAKDDRDKAVRELFRDARFRRALSQAIDRDGIAQSIVRGPLLRAFAGGLYPGAPEFDRSSVVYYPYSVDTAKALLAEIGLQDTDGDGTLNWTSGAMQGQNVVLGLASTEDQAEGTIISELLVPQLSAIGLQVNYRPLTSSTMQDAERSGEWDMRVMRGGQQFALPFKQCVDLAPITKNAPIWHREGDTPRQLQSFEEELVKLVNEYCVERDTAKRKDLINQYNKIYTENNYSIGIIVGRYGLALAKRFKNIPSGTPTFLYTWVESAVMSEQVWTPAADQKEQVRPNTLPEYPAPTAASSASN